MSAHSSPTGQSSQEPPMPATGAPHNLERAERAKSPESEIDFSFDGEELGGLDKIAADVLQDEVQETSTAGHDDMEVDEQQPAPASAAPAAPPKDKGKRKADAAELDPMLDATRRMEKAMAGISSMSFDAGNLDELELPEPDEPDVRDGEAQERLPSDLGDLEKRGYLREACARAEALKQQYKFSEDAWKMLFVGYQGSDRLKGWRWDDKTSLASRGHGKVDEMRFRRAALYDWDNDGSGKTHFGTFNGEDKASAQSFLRVRFLTHSLIPALQLRVQASEQSKPVFVTIFGSGLSINTGANTDKHVRPIVCRTGLHPNRAARERLWSPYMRENEQSLFERSRANQLTEVTLNLLGTQGDTKDARGRVVKPIITGNITDQELVNYGFRAVDAKDPAQPAHERLLGLLYRNELRSFTVYTEYSMSAGASQMKEKQQEAAQKAEFPEWNNLCKYFTTVMILCAELGNFWMLTEQFPNVKWLSSFFPYGRVQPPRWMIQTFKPERKPDTNWDADEMEDMFIDPFQKEVAVLPAEPASWAPFDLPPVMPGWEEMLFLWRLGVAQERRYQFEYIEKLFAWHEWKCKATFAESQQSPNWYLATIEYEIADHKSKPVMPNADTTLEITVEGGSKLYGKTITLNEREQAKSFKAYVRSEKANSFGSDSYKVAIQWRDDNTAYQRQMLALVNLVDEAPDGTVSLKQDRVKGFYLPNLAFGEDVPINIRTGHVARKFSENDFKDAVDNFNMSNEQYELVKGTQTSETGVSLCQGPPGAGKTTCELAAIAAAIKAGQRVLVCAPTNGAMENMYEAFIKLVNSDSRLKALLKWCIFKGAYVKKKKTINSTSQASNKLPVIERPPVHAVPTKEQLDEQLAEEFQQNLFIQLGQTHSNATDEFSAYGFSQRRMKIIQSLAGQTKGRANDDAIEWAQTYLELLKKQGKWKKAAKKFFAQAEEYFDSLALRRMKVTFATCNTSAHETLAEHLKPDTILIDESASGTSVDVLTPCIIHREWAKTVVMVGDHKQQPPTVTSRSKNLAYGALHNTLFAKYAGEESGLACRSDQKPPIHYVQKQYRSHPDIMDWPAQYVYNGRMVHAECTWEDTNVSRTVDEFFINSRDYFEGHRQRYRIGIDVGKTASRAYGNDSSPWNEAECEVVVRLVDQMLRFKATGPKTRQLTAADFIVMSPYSGQRNAIRKALGRVSLHPEAKVVAVSTVANVQGREALIGFNSLVRYDPDRPAELGFIYHQYQLNVAATRPKKLSITVGSFWHWLQAIADAKGKTGINAGQYKVFRGFLEHFRVNNDIITADDLQLILGGVKLPRDKGEFPLEFTKTENAIEMQDVVGEGRSANKRAEPVKFIDSATNKKVNVGKKKKK